MASFLSVFLLDTAVPIFARGAALIARPRGCPCRGGAGCRAALPQRPAMARRRRPPTLPAPPRCPRRVRSSAAAAASSLTAAGGRARALPAAQEAPLYLAAGSLLRPRLLPAAGSGRLGLGSPPGRGPEPSPRRLLLGPEVNLQPPRAAGAGGRFPALPAGNGSVTCSRLDLGPPPCSEGSGAVPAAGGRWAKAGGFMGGLVSTDRPRTPSRGREGTPSWAPHGLSRWGPRVRPGHGSPAVRLHLRRVDANRRSPLLISASRGTFATSPEQRPRGHKR